LDVSTFNATHAATPQVFWQYCVTDRAGNTVLLRSTPVDWGNPRFSPDGKHLALDINDGKQTDIWVQVAPGSVPTGDSRRVFKVGIVKQTG
jgi:Tol biopolymer transport system component